MYNLIYSKNNYAGGRVNLSNIEWSFYNGAFRDFHIIFVKFEEVNQNCLQRNSMATVYTCKRCEYSTSIKSNLLNHLRRLYPCATSNSGQDIPCEVLLKEFEKKGAFMCRFCNKTFLNRSSSYRHQGKCQVKKSESREDLEIEKMKNEILEMKNEIKLLKNRKILERENQRLRNELLKYKTKRTEEFYQVVVENFLGGSHAYLSIGVTDVTNNDTHAEIKEWSSWKHALGQLIVYNTELPKEKLHLYLFGKYDERARQKAVKIITSKNIKCFDCKDDGSLVTIVDMATGKKVFTYDVHQTNTSEACA